MTEATPAVVVHVLAVQTFKCDSSDPDGSRLKRPGPHVVRWFADGKRARFEQACREVRASGIEESRLTIHSLTQAQVDALPVKQRAAALAHIEAG